MVRFSSLKVNAFISLSQGYSGKITLDTPMTLTPLCLVKSSGGLLDICPFSLIIR